MGFQKCHKEPGPCEIEIDIEKQSHADPCRHDQLLRFFKQTKQFNIYTYYYDGRQSTALQSQQDKKERENDAAAPDSFF